MKLVKSSQCAGLIKVVMVEQDTENNACPEQSSTKSTPTNEPDQLWPSSGHPKEGRDMAGESHTGSGLVV